MTRPSIVAGEVVVTSDPAHGVLQPGWVAIDNGLITAVEAGDPPVGIDVLRGDLVMPGLVSAHQHLVDALVRGCPTGPTFLDWLLGGYHAGLSHALPEECAAAVGVKRAAGLAAGVTTVVDCWSVGSVADPQRTFDCAVASIEAHLASGGRTLFAPMHCEVVPDGWLDEDWGVDPHALCRPIGESLAMVTELAAQFHGSGDGRLHLTPSPELPEASTDAGMVAARALASSLGMVMPMHWCASPGSRAACGPGELERLGLLGPSLLAAHCAAVDAGDIARVGHAHVGIAHCPTASRALGRSTPTPLAALRAAGASGGLGLDNASLHGHSDLFAEARQARLTARAQGFELTASGVLDLLTSEGARTIGLPEVGALVPGKRGDVLVLDTSGPHWHPDLGDWTENVVSSATASDVRFVLVDGRVIPPSTGDVAALEAGAARIRAARGR